VVEFATVPHEAKHLVVVGTSLRKPKNILEPYLQSLAWQVVPRGVELVYLFVDDGLDPEAEAFVTDWLKDKQGQLVKSGQGGAPDFSDTHPETHQWTDTAMARVGRNKDWILDAARQNRAEAVWLCDSDLILDPMTLTDLWSIPEQIVAAVYWTKWQKGLPEMNPVHAGPQVWQVHPYTLSGNGMEEWELRKKLVDRQIVHVYGQGACTLIRRGALQKGVSFAPVPGNTGPGLMQGEDRHFCLRAELLHIKTVATGWPDIFHIYHRPEDEQRIPEMLERLRFHRKTLVDVDGSDVGEWQEQKGPPYWGGLVSLELSALEPIHTPNGVMYPPPQLVRGRLGVVGLHPELESALLSMQRGETRIVPTHFPLSHALPPLLSLPPVPGAKTPDQGHPDRPQAPRLPAGDRGRNPPERGGRLDRHHDLRARVA
jgi:hypothetical protein